MNNNTVIQVHNLSKKYRIGLTIRHDTLRDVITDFFCRPFRGKKTHKVGNDEIIWALKDVSFEVGRGEIMGIIGRNGAGKSTILKVLSRITEPTEGRVQIHGRVGSLLEVGTGFHSELTGRENIFLNGAILGMTKREIKNKFDEIVAFAEIGKFIDTPVKRYSSGMHVRLAFAVAAHLEPEILLVDEVLAVGDVAFQRKCLGKMGDVAKEGRTVLFVSHNLGAVGQLCKTGLVLEQGKISYRGEVAVAINRYLADTLDHSGAICSFTPDENKPLQILEVSVRGNDGKVHNRFDINDEICLMVSYIVRKPEPFLTLAMTMSRNGAELLSSFDVDAQPKRIQERQRGVFVAKIHLPRRLLKSGIYSITFATGYLKAKVIEILRDAITFQVQELSEVTMFKSYAEERAGMIISDLTWEDIV